MAEKKPLILVVEDEKIQLDLIIENVNAGGPYHCLPASNGEEAFKILKHHERGFGFLSNRIACILLDWQMPVMNGEQFIRLLRQTESKNPFKRHIPIVIISAYSDNDRYRLARDPTLGMASGYFVKPIDMDELLITLRRIIILNEAEILREILIEKESRWVKEFFRQQK